MRTIKSRSWTIAAILLLAITVSGSEGEVILKNGDRVTGKIIDEGAEAITIETEYAGKIKIARSHVKAFSRSRATTGSTAVAAASAPAANPRPASEEAPIVKRSAPGFRERVKRMTTGWDGNANIGFSYTSGNSNNVTMSTGLRASKATPHGGVTIYVRSLWNSNHGSSANVTTQNAFWGGLRYDRTIDKRLFSFISYDFERDKPKKLDFRSVAGGGLGHRTIKGERTELELLVGGAWNRTWQFGDDSDTPEAIAGLTFKRKINDRLRFQNSLTFYQNVTDAAEHRFIFDATITADITKKVGFYITLGDRFNNDPYGTSKRNDILFTTGMKWNFGKKK